MKVVKWLDKHVEEILICFFFTMMVAVVALQVVMRYIFNSSLSWSDELSRYCFIWMVFLGISSAVKKQQHMSVDVVFLVTKGRIKLVFQIIANLCFLFFAVYGVIYGYSITEKILTWGQSSPALHLPMGLVYLAGPVGFGLTIIRLMQQLILLLKNFIQKEKDVFQ